MKGNKLDESIKLDEGKQIGWKHATGWKHQIGWKESNSMKTWNDLILVLCFIQFLSSSFIFHPIWFFHSVLCFHPIWFLSSIWFFHPVSCFHPIPFIQFGSFIQFDRNQYNPYSLKWCIIFDDFNNRRARKPEKNILSESENLSICKLNARLCKRFAHFCVWIIFEI